MENIDEFEEEIEEDIDELVEEFIPKNKRCLGFFSIIKLMLRGLLNVLKRKKN